MKKLMAIGALALVVSGIAEARNDTLTFPIEAALTSGKAEGLLMQDIKLFFGKQATPEILQPHQILEVTINRKVNSLGKTDAQGCQLALLAALKELQERALKEGANAIVNIRSNLNDLEYSSENEFRCAAGTVVSAVSVKGRIVRLQQGTSESTQPAAPVQEAVPQAAPLEAPQGVQQGSPDTTVP